MLLNTPQCTGQGPTMILGSGLGESVLDPMVCMSSSTHPLYKTWKSQVQNTPGPDLDWDWCCCESRNHWQGWQKDPLESMLGPVPLLTCSPRMNPDPGIGLYADTALLQQGILRAVLMQALGATRCDF